MIRRAIWVDYQSDYQKPYVVRPIAFLANRQKPCANYRFRNPWWSAEPSESSINAIVRNHMRYDQSRFLQTVKTLTQTIGFGILDDPQSHLSRLSKRLSETMCGTTVLAWLNQSVRMKSHWLKWHTCQKEEIYEEWKHKTNRKQKH